MSAAILATLLILLVERTRSPQSSITVAELVDHFGPRLLMIREATENIRAHKNAPDQAERLDYLRRGERLVGIYSRGIRDTLDRMRNNQ